MNAFFSMQFFTWNPNSVCSERFSVYQVFLEMTPSDRFPSSPTSCPSVWCRFCGGICPDSGRDCVKSLRSSYTGLHPQSCSKILPICRAYPSKRASERKRERTLELFVQKPRLRYPCTSRFFLERERETHREDPGINPRRLRARTRWHRPTVGS